jgi:hypothetical protein
MRTKHTIDTDTMRAEYDFSAMKGGVRGKYAASYRAGTNLVLLDPDVAKVFHDQQAVNNALRALIGIAQTQVPATSTRRSTRAPVPA